MEDGKPRWQLIKSRSQGDYKVFKMYIKTMRSERRGVEGDFILLDCPNACNVIAVTEDEQVVMVRQYRFGLGRDTLEFPAGMLDPQEEPLEAAQRELLEETGFGGGEWNYLGAQVINAAFQNNVIHSFFASNVRLIDVQKLDRDEDIDVLLYPLADLHALIADGEIDQAVMLSTIFRYEMWHNTHAR
jgi:NTP pyrophosphohydrolases including oxidative damage repair enzymes